MTGIPHVGSKGVLARADFDRLFAALAAAGYTVVGPTKEDDAVVYREIESTGALPRGWRSSQSAGRYRLEPREDEALFGYVSGTQSWKPYFFRPTRLLWRAKRNGATFSIERPPEDAPRFALLGVRACEIAAMELQDKVFAAGAAPDPDYSLRRANALIVAVNCGEAGDTCFCTSTDTGPKVTRGFDLALTELVDSARHEFLVEVGTAKGAAVAQSLPLAVATADHEAAAEACSVRAAQGMERTLQTEGLKELLQSSQDHPHWNSVAERCLACTNCTLVCPTCFCNTTEDVGELDGATVERRQRWDSCFSLDFSHLHGGSVRPSVASRYRQWMTHKLAHWIDQYGQSGCVGCGRCITWCPAAIDITAEAATLRALVEGKDGDGITPA